MLIAFVIWVAAVALLGLVIAVMPKKGKKSLELGGVQAEPVRTIARESAVAQTVRPFDMAVREVGEGTVVVREVRGRMASALLLVWAGKSRQIGCDSTYQLGTAEAMSGLTEEVIRTFVARAAERLRLITEEAIQKREEKRAARAASQGVQGSGVAADVAASVTVAPPGESDVVGSTPRVVPSERTLEGILRFAGLLKRPDDDYQQFAVQVEVAPGTVRTMYGAGLKNALRRVNAVLGTKLKIEKVGRQAMPGGLRSKTLFQVIKLDGITEAANESVSDDFAPIQFCA